MKKHVEAGSALYNDDLKSYEGLQAEYAHKVIDHAVAYVDRAVIVQILRRLGEIYAV